MNELTPNGTAIIGDLVKDRTQLIISDQVWEMTRDNVYCIEGPWMIYNKDNGFYYLFYSGSMYNTDTYNIGVARSKNILGPYVKHYGPILHTRWGSPYIDGVNPVFAGPGHCSVIKNDDNEYLMIYHSWKYNNINNGYRYLMLDKIIWIDHWPQISSNTPSQNVTSI